jgi:hypothetical protein
MLAMDKRRLALDFSSKNNKSNQAMLADDGENVGFSFLESAVIEIRYFR